MVRGQNNSSSIEGGIFGEPTSKQAPPNAQNINRSSVEGGIFGGYTDAPASRRVGVTKSSVEGGIFSGGAYAADSKGVAPANIPKVAPIDSSRVAGQAMPMKENFSLFSGEGAAPLQPLPSARSNPNAPSVEGGIFGAPTMQKPAISRSNPNASSIEGGIFG